MTDAGGGKSGFTGKSPNPFTREDFDFQFDPDTVSLGINARTGADIATIQNLVDDAFLIFERVEDDSLEGFTWWCVGRADGGDNRSRCVEPYNPAPLANEIPQIAKLEEVFQKIPAELRNEVRSRMTASQN